MTLREEINELVEEISEWYVEQLMLELEMLEDKGIPLFLEEVEEPE